METELKLKVPAADMERLRSHPMLQETSGEQRTEHHLVDTYYDTPGCDLWKHGLTLRVRKDNDTWIQTVKTASETSTGLYERGEWESTLEDALPRPDVLVTQIEPARLAKLLASPKIVQHLTPIFQNTTHRTSWNIALSTGEHVECALDAGDIACGAKHASISELELELKDGDPAHLFDLALALHQDVPLQISSSKASRGYQLLDDQPIKARKAAGVHLTRKMTLEDAFKVISLNCLQQIEANIPGVLKQDVESLHQMRVGLRRLRALLNMFEKLVAAPAPLRENIDWLAGELGATRDWDVLASSTLDAIPNMDSGALRDATAAKALELHRQLVQSLRTPRFTKVILQLNGWIRGRQWRKDGVLSKKSLLAERAIDAAKPLLRIAEKRLTKRIDALDTTDAPARHKTRIAAKKARYAAEFFVELLPHKQVAIYVERLSKLQDRLGILNDIAIAVGLLDEINGSSAQVARQAAYVRGYLAATAEADTKKLAKPLANIAKLRITS